MISWDVYFQIQNTDAFGRMYNDHLLVNKLGPG